MDGMAPMTSLELLEQLGGSGDSKSEMKQEVGNSPTGTSQFDNAPMQDVVGSLSSGQLEQWIRKTAEQFEVDGDGIGLMLVAQLALVHSKIRRLIDRPDAAENSSILAPWSNAVTKLMAEFRRGYIALGNVQELRARKRRIDAKTAEKSCKRSRGRKKTATFADRQTLN